MYYQEKPGIGTAGTVKSTRLNHACGTCYGRYRCAWPTASRLLLLTALLLAQLITGGESQRKMVRKVDAPAIVDPRKEMVELGCDYDLHGNELYSVSWYKNNDMLFKYSPSLEIKSSAYEAAGVNVSLKYSNAERIMLVGSQDVRKNVQAYEGTYLCEVSTEQPFLTDYAMANVSAAILPRSKPALEGVAPNYHVGEQLEAECTAAPSLPAAEITFYLNGQKVSRAYTRSKTSRHSVGDALGSTQSSLVLRLQRDHFPGGILTVGCRATLPGLAVPQDSKTERTATLAADNQRLAQEPPRLPSSSGAPVLRLSLLAALPALRLAVVGILSLR